MGRDKLLQDATLSDKFTSLVGKKTKSDWTFTLPLTVGGVAATEAAVRHEAITPRDGECQSTSFN